MEGGGREGQPPHHDIVLTQVRLEGGAGEEGKGIQSKCLHSCFILCPPLLPHATITP